MTCKNNQKSRKSGKSGARSQKTEVVSSNRTETVGIEVSPSTTDGVTLHTNECDDTQAGNITNTVSDASEETTAEQPVEASVASTPVKAPAAGGGSSAMDNGVETCTPVKASNSVAENIDDTTPGLVQTSKPNINDGCFEFETEPDASVAYQRSQSPLSGAIRRTTPVAFAVADITRTRSQLGNKGRILPIGLEERRKMSGSTPRRSMILPIGTPSFVTNIDNEAEDNRRSSPSLYSSGESQLNSPGASNILGENSNASGSKSDLLKQRTSSSSYFNRGTHRSTNSTLDGFALSSDYTGPYNDNVGPFQSTDSINTLEHREFLLRRANANKEAAVHSRVLSSSKPADPSLETSSCNSRAGTPVGVNKNGYGYEPMGGAAGGADNLKSGLFELQQNFNEIPRNQEVTDGVDWEFWTQVVQDYSRVVASQPSKLKNAILAGFPPVLRTLLWQVIASSKNPGLEQFYASLADVESEHTKTINKDLARTSLVKQVDQQALFRVLKAYSLFDPEVGYTQGMAFVVVPILFDMSEYEAFCLTVQLMKVYDLRSMFLKGMPGLHLKLYQFERLVEDRLETVHIHLKRQGVLPTMYASQWFLTIFSYKFPIQLVQRIFDLLISEGSESLLRVAFALMAHSADKILQMQFEELLMFLKENIFDWFIERPNDLVKIAAAIELSPSILATYELEYKEIHRIENEREAQLNTLRTNNTKLTLQVRQLESLHSDLNSEHVDIVNKMISTGLENASLRAENTELQMELKVLRMLAESEKDRASMVKENLELKEIQARLEAQIEGLQEALATAL